MGETELYAVSERLEPEPRVLYDPAAGLPAGGVEEVAVDTSNRNDPTALRRTPRRVPVADARCQAMGLQDGANAFSFTLCYESLRAIRQGEKWLYCALFSVKFSLASVLCASLKCPCCSVGILTA